MKTLDPYCHKSNPPLITIGLTCFDAVDTISRAITSALNQDWPNFEVIIVDDCSRDSSVKLIQNAIANVDNARLICNEQNLGPAGSRNIILQNAKGDFIAFFDDDDESLPDRLSEQVTTICNYEQVTQAKLVACYASGQRHYDNGYTIELQAIGSHGNIAPNGPAVAEYLLLYRKQDGWFYGTGTPSCSLMARKESFEAVGGFDSTLRRVEDSDIAIRWALAGGHFIGSPKPVFTQHATQAFDKSPEKNCEAEKRLAMKYKSFLDGLGLYYYALHWPELRYWHFKRNYVRFAFCLLGLLLHNPVDVIKHLLATGPKRFRHEQQIKRISNSS